MATSQATIEYLMDQLSSVDGMTNRKMFGEYALYHHGKVVALVCDDTLFVKITEEGKAFIGADYKEGRAYPGAKPSMKIGSDVLEDHARLCELIRITSRNLPAPKAKLARKTNAKPQQKPKRATKAKRAKS